MFYLFLIDLIYPSHTDKKQRAALGVKKSRWYPIEQIGHFTAAVSFSDWLPNGKRRRIYRFESQRRLLRRVKSSRFVYFHQLTIGAGRDFLRQCAANFGRGNKWNSLAPQKVRKLRQKTSFDCALDTPQQTCGGVALRTGQFGPFVNFLDILAFGIFWWVT